jgi:hypothetical protein
MARPATAEFSSQIGKHFGARFVSVSDAGEQGLEESARLVGRILELSTENLCSASPAHLPQAAQDGPAGSPANYYGGRAPSHENPDWLMQQKTTKKKVAR